MDLRPVFYVIGVFLCILAASMVLPMLADLYTASADWKVFFLCIVITAFFGGSLVLSNSGQKFDISVRQAFLLTVLSWLILCIFGALPFYMSELNMSFADSFFESMSGITTTGATVITGLDHAPKGILLWRGMLHLLGGLGFIVMGISVLPMLKVGGMRLFRTESSEREKALPRTAQTANSITTIYLFLVLLCTLCLMFSGMGIFDAVVHAMGALATGGFSNYDQSVGAFKNPLAEIVLIVFMIAGALPFILYIRAFKGSLTPLYKDTQIRTFLTIILVVSLIMTADLVLNGDAGFFDALRRSVFHVTSLITTTGMVSEDYMSWGPLALSLFFFITFIGGCSGSTTGGIKIFRFQVLFSVMNVQIKRLLHPHGVFIPYYNGKPIPRDVPGSVMGFFFVYMLVFALAVVGLSFTGLDFTTAMSGVIACLSNAGPGLGSIVGPAGTYQPISDAATWILSLCMLLGRLELFTLLVLLSPHFWRH